MMVGSGDVMVKRIEMVAWVFRLKASAARLVFPGL